MPDSTHPIWITLRLAILMLTMTTILWINCTKFDSTEIKALVQMFLVAGGLETVQRAILGRIKNG